MAGREQVSGHVPLLLLAVLGGGEDAEGCSRVRMDECLLSTAVSSALHQLGPTRSMSR